MNTMTPEEEKLYHKAQRIVKRTKNYYNAIIGYFAVCTFLTLLNWYQMNFTNYGHWWVGWVWFGWGIGMFFYTINYYKRDVFFGENWEQRKIKEEMEKLKRS
jgi:hypothetical protein